MIFSGQKRAHTEIAHVENLEVKKFASSMGVCYDRRPHYKGPSSLVGGVVL
jgi:hypothetical protein